MTGIKKGKLGMVIKTNNKIVRRIMKLRFLQAICALFLLINIPIAGQATTVSFDVTNISGNTWEYTYNVANDTLGIDIEEFTIFFDVALYENLSVTSTPAAWDPLVIQPDPGLPDDGFYDALALVVGIAPGDSLGGFGVQFDFLGSGIPGVQTFDIVDTSTFATLDSGLTQVVPIPAALWLFGSGLLCLFGLQHRVVSQRN